MTDHRWTTTADVPLSQWAALSADLRTMLAVMARTGATIAGVDGPAPAFTDAVMAFTVQLPGRGPLAVTFRRTAGEGLVSTSSTVTDGLVLAMLRRAARHWGRLLVINSEADTAAASLSDVVSAQLFGAGDLAVTGTSAGPVPVQVSSRVRDALTRTSTRSDATSLDLLAYLDAVAADLAQQRAGIAAALGLFTLPAAPTAVAATTAPVDEVPVPTEVVG